MIVIIIIKYDTHQRLGVVQQLKGERKDKGETRETDTSHMTQTESDLQESYQKNEEQRKDLMNSAHIRSWELYDLR